jgi:hypothetical protein
MSSQALILSAALSAKPFLMLASLRPCGAPFADSVTSPSAAAPASPAAAVAPVNAAARMNSRRFRYTFLSVISELRMFDAFLISMSAF